MASIIEPQREIPIVGDLDVVVAGGGTAGFVAAIAAARNGARTLVLERAGFLGGHIAGQLLEHSAGFHDAKGTQIVGGIPAEVVRRLKELGASPGFVRDDTGYTKTRVPILHEEFKSLVPLLFMEAGVEFLVHSPVVKVITEDTTVQTVIVENKSGRQAYRAKTFVDCTGDADIAALAGVGFQKGRQDDGLTQPVSLLFKLGGINFDQLLDYVEEAPHDFRLGVSPKSLRGEDYVNLWGFRTLLEKGHSAGVLSLARKEMHFSGWVRTGEGVINVTRAQADGTDACSLSKAEAILRRQVLEFVRFFRQFVPGCEHAYLAASASSVGVRETRRIQGLYQLSDEDVRKGRRFEDAIAQGGFPIDSHDPLGNSMEAAENVPTAFDIPYRCLVPAEIDGLLVAGRSISAERKALASARVTATCMAMGQAAGTAAALCSLKRVSPRNLDIDELRSVLRAQEAILA